MEQVNIFSGYDVIRSVSFDQDEIISNIIKLYIPAGVECDPTYSKGNFYINIPKPKYRYDLVVQSDDVVCSDCRELPLADASVASIMFDPPFIIGAVPKGKKPRMMERFGSYKNIDSLWKMYGDSLREFYRILKPNGVLVFKCQDLSKYGNQYFSEFKIMKMALACGYYPKDKFILLAKQRMGGPAGKYDQVHSRKFHSYFLVFIKCKSLVNYEDSGI